MSVYLNIYIDLETTGFANNCEVLQIAALSERGSQYMTYILPERDIPEDVTQLTGITKRGNKLLHHDKEVDTTPKITAWEELLSFFYSFDQDIVLIGHNLIPFDFRIIKKNLTDLQMFHLFQSKVYGLCDTLAMSRKLYPGRESYTLKNIAIQFGIQQVDAHNAEDDIKVVRDVVLLWEKANPGCINNYTKNLEEYIKKKREENNKAYEKMILRYKCGDKLHKNVIGKLVNKGITCDVLENGFQKGGRMEIENIVRDVTKNKKFIENICQIFS